MLYTSGTTGKPKGVVLSNRNVIETARNSSDFDHLSAGEDILAYLPMAWVGDFIFSVGQAYWTGFCVNCPESPDTMMTDLREIGPTYFFAPPRVFENLLTTVMIRMEDSGRLKKRLFDHFMAHARRVGPAILDGKPVSGMDRFRYALGKLFIYGPLKNTLGFSRVRVGYTAGEAIGPEIFDFYRSLGINLKQLYGQTEATVFITQQPDGEVRADTVGVPSPGVELKITDAESGATLPDGEAGIIEVRGPNVFQGYWQMPEKTKAELREDGFFITGDIGVIDPDGYVQIVGRAKDLIISGGYNIYPKEVELVLDDQPGVLESAVIGVPHPDFGEGVVGVLVAEPGATPDLDAIRASVGEKLAKFKQPKVLEVVTELPRNTMGKVQKNMLRDQFAEAFKTPA